MTDYRKITGMPPAGTLTGNEWIEVVQGGINKKAKIGAVAGGGSGTGAAGKSAYELAVEEGNFVGSLSDWLDSLQGDVGPVGPQGPAGTGGGGTGGGMSIAYRQLSVTNNGLECQIAIVAYGSQDLLDQVTVVQSGGTTLTIDNVGEGLILSSVSVAYVSAFNATAAFSFVYPAPFGVTEQSKLIPPNMINFIDDMDPLSTTPIGMGNTGGQSFKLNGGLVTMSKSGLGVGTAGRFKYVLL